MHTTKEELRQAVRHRRAGVGSALAAEAGTRILAQLAGFAPYRAATVVLGYLETDGEAPTGPVLADALRRGKRVFVPAANADWFVEYHERVPLERGAWGVSEPVGTASFVAADEAGIIFVPVVAWDRRGGRLGRGTGWYDRILPRVAMPRVGVAFDWQEETSVPTDGWDERIDYVVTESRLVSCGRDVSVERLP